MEYNNVVESLLEPGFSLSRDRLQLQATQSDRRQTHDSEELDELVLSTLFRSSQYDSAKKRRSAIQALGRFLRIGKIQNPKERTQLSIAMKVIQKDIPPSQSESDSTSVQS